MGIQAGAKTCHQNETNAGDDHGVPCNFGHSSMALVYLLVLYGICKLYDSTVLWYFMTVYRIEDKQTNQSSILIIIIHTNTIHA